MAPSHWAPSAPPAMRLAMLELLLLLEAAQHTHPKLT